MAIKFVLNETSYFGDNARENLVEEINKRNLSLILAEDNPELTIDAGVMVKDLIMQMFDREIVHSFKEIGSILKEFNDYTSQVGQKYIQKQKSPEAIEE